MAENFESFAQETQSAAQRYHLNLEAIIAKYDRPYPESDIVNLSNMTIVVDNGHLGRKKEKVFGKTKLPKTRLKEMKKYEKSDSGIGSINTSDADISEDAENETFAFNAENKAQLTILEDMYSILLDTADDVDLSEASELSSTLSSVSDDDTDSADRSLVMADDDGWESDSSCVVKYQAPPKNRKHHKTNDDLTIERTDMRVLCEKFNDSSVEKLDGFITVKPKSIILRRNSSSNEEDLHRSIDEEVPIKRKSCDEKRAFLYDSVSSEDNSIANEASEAASGNADRRSMGRKYDFAHEIELSDSDNEVVTLIEDSSLSEDDEKDVPKSDSPRRNYCKRNILLNDTFIVDTSNSGQEELKRSYQYDRTSDKSETRATYKHTVTSMHSSVFDKVYKFSCHTKSETENVELNNFDNRINVKMYGQHQLNTESDKNNSPSSCKDTSQQLVRETTKEKSNEPLPKRLTVSHHVIARPQDDGLSISPKFHKQLQSPIIRKFSDGEIISMLSSPKPLIIDNGDTIAVCNNSGRKDEQNTCKHRSSLSHIKQPADRPLMPSSKCDLKDRARCSQKSCGIQSFDVQMNSSLKSFHSESEENVSVDQRILTDSYMNNYLVSKEIIDIPDYPSKANQEISIKKSWDEVCSLARSDKKKSDGAKRHNGDIVLKTDQKSAVKSAFVKSLENDCYSGHIKEVDLNTQYTWKCNSVNSPKNTVSSQQSSQVFTAGKDSPSTMLRKMQLFSPLSRAKQDKQSNSVEKGNAKTAKKKLSCVVMTKPGNDGAIRKESGHIKQGTPPKVSRRQKTMETHFISTPSRSDVSILDISSLSSISNASSRRLFDHYDDDGVETVILDDDEISDQGTVIEQPVLTDSSQISRDDRCCNDDTTFLFAHHRAVVPLERKESRAKCTTKTSHINNVCNMFTQQRNCVKQSDRCNLSEKNSCGTDQIDKAANCTTRISSTYNTEEHKSSVSDLSLDDSDASIHHRQTGSTRTEVKNSPTTCPSLKAPPSVRRILKAQKSLTKRSPSTKCNTPNRNTKGKSENREQKNLVNVRCSLKQSGNTKISDSPVFTRTKITKLNVQTVKNVSLLNMSVCPGPGKCSKTFCFTCFNE